MRELRIQHAGEPYRVLYAFDPRRTAILLIGGNSKFIMVAPDLKTNLLLSNKSKQEISHYNRVYDTLSDPGVKSRIERMRCLLSYAISSAILKLC